MARGNQRDKARVSRATQDIKSPSLNEMLIFQPGKNPKGIRCAEEEEYGQSSSIPILPAPSDALLLWRLSFFLVNETDRRLTVMASLAIGDRVRADEGAAGGDNASETGRRYVLWEP